MEPANAHHHHHLHLHHHLQDQLVGSSSTSYFHGVGSTHANWIPNPILSTNGVSSYTTPLASNSPYMNFNMAPDLGLITTAGSFINQYSEINNEQPNDICTKTFSSGNQLMNAPPRIFPSINVPNSYPSELRDIPTAGGCFDMNLQALDLLTSSGFSGSLINSGGASQNQIGVFRDELSYGFGDHIPLFMTSNKISATSSNGNAAAKRPSSKMALLSSAPKKSCSETRASCPPFKVRKEKLGDRIAALHQLVAPFGKTDTASVLMEAIGYIKFLQNQVETLSVPYMKTSRNKTSRVIKRVAAENENTEETKNDLKTGGLCLVPLSCLSYLSDGGGAVVWPPCT